MSHTHLMLQILTRAAVRSSRKELSREPLLIIQLPMVLLNAFMTVEVFFESLSSSWSLGRSIATCTAWYMDLLKEDMVAQQLSWFMAVLCWLPREFFPADSDSCPDPGSYFSQLKSLQWGHSMLHPECYRHQFFTRATRSSHILSRICPTWCSEKAPSASLWWPL